MGFINILKDYEQIGDIVEKNIIYLAESKYANNIHFSEEGQKELSIMAEKINDSCCKCSAGNKQLLLSGKSKENV
ncbi:hypothetical protein M1N67_02910 [Peptococcaceae bacterium]|nr:hypothetical protein [Peptococcaceae bacterium]